ncbi:zinc finger CCCH domain-containing protein 50 [Scenedesmus sp. PABB004]|nr:zinc finger CCCH domain-containing protein 50 [Scenedesmus sp. PABB004]
MREKWSAEQLMAGWKVETCPRRGSHDWQACFYCHPNEKVRRRSPSTHAYAAALCPDQLSRGTCPAGDACRMSHSIFEYWLHPDKFRTQVCVDGQRCKRCVCFFAHGPDELRLPSYKAAAEADAQLERAAAALQGQLAHVPALACGDGGGGSSASSCTSAVDAGSPSRAAGAPAALLGPPPAAAHHGAALAMASGLAPPPLPAQQLLGLQPAPWPAALSAGVGQAGQPQPAQWAFQQAWQAESDAAALLAALAAVGLGSDGGGSAAATAGAAPHFDAHHGPLGGGPGWGAACAGGVHPLHLAHASLALHQPPASLSAAAGWAGGSGGMGGPVLQGGDQVGLHAYSGFMLS